jgi:hypothetical protein
MPALSLEESYPDIRNNLEKMGRDLERIGSDLKKDKIDEINALIDRAKELLSTTDTASLITVLENIVLLYPFDKLPGESGLARMLLF